MTARRFQFTVDHMLGRQEVELVVTYSMTPARPYTPPSYSHGGLPPEDAEVELVSIKHNGKPVTLSDEEEAALLEMAIDRSSQDWEDEKAAEADWHYQERRDRLLMERWECDE